MADCGYDEGYIVCPCFWGDKPAGMVLEALALLGKGEDRRALDLGCGEGKNAAAIARAGFQVLAIDKSHAAISNAMKAFSKDCVNWLVSDLRGISGPRDNFDLIIATGSLHCLSSEEEISQAVAAMQRMTKISGINVLYSFNDGPQDMGGHDKAFHPTLLSHEKYLKFYDTWEIIHSTNITQRDEHPHNGVEHFHSITRILARRLV